MIGQRLFIINSDALLHIVGNKVLLLFLGAKTSDQTNITDNLLNSTSRHVFNLITLHLKFSPFFSGNMAYVNIKRENQKDHESDWDTIKRKNYNDKYTA